MTVGRRIRCALLSPQPYWPGEVALACPGLEIFAFAPSVLGRIETHNPFDLPEADRVDVALVGSWWYTWLADHYSDRVEAVIRRLEASAEMLVGLNGPDRFNLDFPPSVIDRLASVLCLQGMYRDRDLYNYVVGPQYPGANWMEKRDRRGYRYGSSQLEKLRLSVPCFVIQFPAVRSRARRWVRRRARGAGWRQRLLPLGQGLANRLTVAGLGILPGVGRSLDVHCHVGLSHIQRIEALRLLEGFSGTLGIAPTQSLDLVYGTGYGGAELPPRTQKALAAEAGRYARPAVSRLRYLAAIRRHKIAVAPTGYGEIGYRHGEIMLAGAALVCQDLSHVEMLLPLKDRRNAVFCRPDLSDLPDVVEDLLLDDQLRTGVARRGRQDILGWASDWRRQLVHGFEAHIRASL